MVGWLGMVGEDLVEAEEAMVAGATYPFHFAS